MPEIVTQYPYIVLDVLKRAHIDCGVGKPQNILIHCPKEQFCALQSGELCIYGINQINKVTQFNSVDILLSSSLGIYCSLLLVVAFGVGVFFGRQRVKR